MNDTKLEEQIALSSVNNEYQNQNNSNEKLNSNSIMSLPSASNDTYDDHLYDFIKVKKFYTINSSGRMIDVAHPYKAIKYHDTSDLTSVVLVVMGLISCFKSHLSIDPIDIALILIYLISTLLTLILKSIITGKFGVIGTRARSVSKFLYMVMQALIIASYSSSVIIQSTILGINQNNATIPVFDNSTKIP